MTDFAKVSIVVPVYNSEKHLRFCLDSILSQTYDNIELIIVDDGSSDSSADIIKEYMQKNDFIKYFYQQNAGAGKARNRGIAEVTGEYILFCDSDDGLSENFVADLVEEAKNGYDMVVTGYTNMFYDGTVLSRREISNKPLSFFTNVATAAKLYRRDFIIGNNIRFAEDSVLLEDAFFTLKALSLSSKTTAIAGAGYHIMQNPDSITHTQGKSMFVIDGIVSLFEKIKDEISLNDAALLDYFFIKSAIYCILFSCKGSKKDVLYEKYDKIFNWVSKNTTKKNRYLSLFGDFGEVFSVKLVISLFRILQGLKIIKPILYIYSRI